MDVIGALVVAWFVLSMGALVIAKYILLVALLRRGVRIEWLWWWTPGYLELKSEGCGDPLVEGILRTSTPLNWNAGLALAALILMVVIAFAKRLAGA